jgi:hypothetical protein
VGRRVWSAIALACAVWVAAQLVAAALAGTPAPNPVAGLLAADVQQAGAAEAGGTARAARPEAVPALAPAARGQGMIRVDLLSGSRAPRAVLLCNAAPVARFTGASVAVPVSGGDLLEIDGSAYRQPLIFQVVAAEGIAAPPVGLRAVTRGDIAVLGRVRLQVP